MKKSELRQLIKQSIKETIDKGRMVPVREANKNLVTGYVRGNIDDPICQCPDGKKYINCGNPCDCCDEVGKTIDPPYGPDGKPFDPIGPSDQTGSPGKSRGKEGKPNIPPISPFDPNPEAQIASEGCDCYDSDGNLTGHKSPECCKMGFRDGMEEAQIGGGKKGCLCNPNRGDINSPSYADTTYVPIYHPDCCKFKPGRMAPAIRGMRGMREQSTQEPSQQNPTTVKRRGPVNRNKLK